MAYIHIIILAIKTVFNKSTYLIAWIVLSIFLAALYIYIPVTVITGDTLSFQMGLYTPTEFILFALLSVTTSLLILLQFFTFSSSHKNKQKSAVAANGGIGVLSGVLAGMLTSITCVPCVIGFLGIFGSLSTLLVIGEYQTYIAIAALLIVVWGIYYTSLRITGYCKTCDVY